MMGYGYNMMGYGYNMMGGVSDMMIIPIILIAAVIYMIFKQQKNSNLKVWGAKDNSLNVLNERFARGEITEEEYHRMKALLNNR